MTEAAIPLPLRDLTPLVQRQQDTIAWLERRLREADEECRELRTADLTHRQMNALLHREAEAARLGVRELERELRAVTRRYRRLRRWVRSRIAAPLALVALGVALAFAMDLTAWATWGQP